MQCIRYNGPYLMLTPLERDYQIFEQQVIIIVFFCIVIFRLFGARTCMCGYLFFEDRLASPRSSGLRCRIIIRWAMPWPALPSPMSWG
jgi:hypothetical protein